MAIGVCADLAAAPGGAPVIAQGRYARAHGRGMTVIATGSGPHQRAHERRAMVHRRTIHVSANPTEEQYAFITSIQIQRTRGYTKPHYPRRRPGFRRRAFGYTKPTETWPNTTARVAAFGPSSTPETTTAVRTALPRATSLRFEYRSARGRTPPGRPAASDRRHGAYNCLAL